MKLCNVLNNFSFTVLPAAHLKNAILTKCVNLYDAFHKPWNWRMASAVEGN